MTDKNVGYIYNLNFALGQDKNITVTGNFEKSATSDEMSAELDKVMIALEKQRIKRLELPTAEGALNDQKERLATEKHELAKLGAKIKLSTAEQSQAAGHRSTIERLEEVIPKGEQFVAELRQKAA